MNNLLQMLMDGRFHSGQELGQHLGISRSSVWKKLHQLEKDFGIEIHKVPGKGYRLAESLSLLDTQTLQDCAQSLGWNLQVHEQIDSTNAECLRQAQQHPKRPLVITAEFQTAGRGRRGRQWVSPVIGQNVFFSLLLELQESPQVLSGLSLVVGLAVLETLKGQGVQGLGLKWPNDIYANKRKIAGVLLELTGNPVDVCHLVIGIGINVNMRCESSSAQELINQPWTSMRTELDGQLVDRTALSGSLMQHLNTYLQQHLSQGFKSLRPQWESWHLWQGQECILSSGTQEVIGQVLGVDDDGSLRMRVNGEDQSFCAGELSLRLAQ